MLGTALLFPGQGSQFVGMCSEMYKQYDIVKQTFEEASEVLDFNIYKLCTDGDLEQLTKTENAQPAVLTSSVAAYRVFMQEIGLNPVFCAGHSLGEISALSCTGAIGFSDAVKMVQMRGKFMQEAVREGVGAMSAIVGNDVELEVWTQHECEKYSKAGHVVVISNYNSKGQLVISGHKDAVKKVGDVMRSRGAKVISLKVSAPFHCHLMQPAAERIKSLLDEFEIKNANIPVISNVDARPYTHKDDVKNNIYRQMTSPVQWLKSIQYMRSRGTYLAFELGPKAVLKRMVEGITCKITVIPITDAQKISSAKKLIEENSMKEKAKMKQAKFKLVEKCMSAAVCTKNMNYNSEQYNEGVVKTYSTIKHIWDKIVMENTEPTNREIERVLEMLKLIFDTKQVPEQEQKERLDEIFLETGLCI
ncbi:ACP S-malonyltransferase [Wukongibacter sp. M2B1]|uniref:ACP S-malonyltransferase n=1 Tax=Wukongibacter sp. M2B1 TaxID=3088895 RepID=UPI003D7AA6C2